MGTLVNQQFNRIIERKIKYDSTIVEHACRLLKACDQTAVLFHKIQYTFTMTAEQVKLTIPKGSYTIAYYWKDRPYNLYIWRDGNGAYLGAYFNIVRQTKLTDQFLSFEDLIIDIMVLPNGTYFILDEDELPEPIEQFENGTVHRTLQAFIHSMPVILDQLILESEHTYAHQWLLPLLHGY
ncbi:DUF402 domain-containing protein [Bacillus badius]|uniref:DUF402 domain-containing protein n=1 Tax=Bacillus badius TaxID=1455 RepID=A0ABR5AZG7_BACBA|nr:DUF402 domain-containing protein [Bacillus badius]KIL75008.1 hypothetical protein SD78_2077 [Bacillus badius]KIL80010.1 hypothetical protein SD77_2464 [Bacillus badius]KZR60142.1 hypothetical protein A3781_08075 [Bacillus badius]MED4717953.1 DUF402 domain-containing protein [Bacillus badius]